MWARSCATRWAIARTAVSIVPSAGSRTDSYAASAARANAAATSTGSTSSPGRETSSAAAPRTICDRITPLFPRAPSRAARATAWTIASRPITSIGSPFMRSSSSSTARMVMAMLSPVSPSATGKTLRSLTSWRRASSSAYAAATALRNRTRLGSGTGRFYTDMPDRFHLSAGTVRGRDGLDGLGDLTRLKATRADILAAGGAGHEDADLLEVGVEASLGGHHRVAAAMPERRALSAHVTHLRHGGEG